MAGDSGTRETRCGTSDAAVRTVSLSILETSHGPKGNAVRASKNGRRRAVVLGLIQLLIIVHLVQWAITGRTVSPLEPSESMQTLELGYVNAGFILFALALLATLIFGRFFCGWGCHLVMLQDLCGWMMKKVGVRPKPFRSRLLIYAPLALALYMFVWPNFKRFGVLPILERWWPDGLRFFQEVPAFSGFTNHLVTEDFWATFPSWLVAIPFLFICGFAAVYFLGAKGFCTYGCPYGGFFAPLDEFAPGRIRVTDACEQCGHCTAVCTSNVRVHEEVREYGMVVDPGCMKCMDCVSVCPNDALYFGFGRPAQRKGRAKNAAPVRKYDLSLGEEIVFGAVFLFSFLALRGIYGVVPLLMAIGCAGVITFLAWKLWRMTRDANVAIYRHRLRRDGRWTRGGLAFAGVTVLVLGLTLHSGAVNAALITARHHDRQVTIPRTYVLSEVPMLPPETMLGHVDRAIAAYELGGGVADGGVGIVSTAENLTRLAWLYSCRHDFERAEEILRTVMERHGRSVEVVLNIGEIMRAQLQYERLVEFLQQAIEHQPRSEVLVDALVQQLEAMQRTDDAIRVCREGLAANPDSLLLMRRLSLLLVTYDDLEEGIALIRRTLEIDPDNAYAHLVLANALLDLDLREEVPGLIDRALALAPGDIQLHRQAVFAARRLGDTEREEAAFAKLQELLAAPEPP